MKKILSFIVLCGVIANANAFPMIQTNPNVYTHHSSAYYDGYKDGYHSGKNRGYGNVLKAVVIVGGFVLLGTAIYELGKESCLTANENGIVYRF